MYLEVLVIAERLDNILFCHYSKIVLRMRIWPFPRGILKKTHVPPPPPPLLTPNIKMMLFLRTQRLALIKVLTVQKVIAKNAHIFMHKIVYFPNLLPKSVREAIPNIAPNYTNEDNMALVETYENAGPYFRT